MHDDCASYTQSGLGVKNPSPRFDKGWHDLTFWQPGRPVILSAVKNLVAWARFFAVLRMTSPTGKSGRIWQAPRDSPA